MRLCGISNCFQLVSPCIRQVIHALLTRPPLIQKSLGFIPNPFDLHVLGTPPAFILSQDQTLMFYDCFLLPVSLWLLSSIFSYSGLLFLGCPLLDFSCPLKFSLPSALLFQACFGIFRAALLFICQGSVFAFCSLLSSATTLIEYHIFVSVSTTFFIFF